MDVYPWPHMGVCILPQSCIQEHEILAAASGFWLLAWSAEADEVMAADPSSHPDFQNCNTDEWCLDCGASIWGEEKTNLEIYARRRQIMEIARFA